MFGKDVDRELNYILDRKELRGNGNLEFFVIDSKVPILLGNIVLEPLGGSVNLEERKLVLAKLQKKVNLVKMPSGILLFLFGIWLWLKKILMKQTEEISTEMKQMKS